MIDDASFEKLYADKTLQRIAHRVARRYKKVCWWASEADLRQEAWWAIFRARKSFNPERGTSFTRYVFMACSRWLYGVVLRESAPVSAGWDKLPELKGLYRAPIEKAGGAQVEDETAEDILVDVERQTAFMKEVLRVAEAAEAEKYVTSVLSGEARPRKIAALRGIQAKQVYLEQQRFMYHARKNEALRDLWEDQ